MKFLLSLTLVSVIGMSVTATAQAHFLKHRKHMTLPQRVKYFKASLWHDRTSLKWLRAVKSNFRVMYANTTVIDRKENLSVIDQQLRWHEKALRWHENLLKYYGGKLRAEQVKEWLRTRLPPHYSQWLCIHGYEGSWTANTGNGYFGGLQMDSGFMSSYGASLLKSKGTANNWTPLEQMWVAENAYRSRGFYPWPNTARYCGLI